MAPHQFQETHNAIQLNTPEASGGTQERAEDHVQPVAQACAGPQSPRADRPDGAGVGDSLRGGLALDHCLVPRVRLGVDKPPGGHYLVGHYGGRPERLCR